MLILMGGNTGNPDTGIYYDMYYSSTLFTKDVLFGLIINGSKWIGLSVDEFRFIICLISLGCIFSTVLKYVDNIFLFIILYISFPYFYDVVQLRNFLGIAIFIYSIPYILEKGILKKLFAVICMIVAMLIQKTHMILPLFLIVAVLMSKKKIFKLIYIMSSLILSVVIFIPDFTNILSSFLSSTGLKGINGFTVRVTAWGWLYKYSLHFMNCCILYYIKRNFFSNLDSRKYRLFNLIYYLNLSSTVCLCLYVINPTYSRILRNITILDFIVVAAYFSQNIISISKSSKALEFLILMMYCIFMFSTNFLVSQETFTSLVANLFQHNWILFGDHSTGNWLK